MSFDLFVWHEQDPITAAEARTKLERWSDGEVEVFAPNPAIARFYDELLRRFPPLESFTDEDVDRLGVWSMTPQRSESIVAASCVWSRADEVGGAILTLAGDNGLICYEPGYHIVNPNAPGHRAAFTLSSECIPTIPDPDARRLAWIMTRLASYNPYVILERADGWFVQVGYGEPMGVPAGAYALEYQEGSLDKHFRCETTDRVDPLRLLQEFLAGDDGWKHRHRWQPL